MKGTIFALAILALVLIGINTQGATIYVDDDNEGNMSATGAEDNPYGTIQDGIQNAVIGDTIRVFAGNYSPDDSIDEIDVYKRVLLIGNGTTESIIRSGGDGDGLLISASNCSISFFGITGSKTNRGLRIASHGNLIEDCRIFNSTQGIRINNTRTHNTISDSVVTNCSAGISINGQYTNIRASQIKDISGIGIMITSANATIDSCVIDNCTDNAIYVWGVWGTDSCIIENSTLRNTKSSHSIIGAETLFLRGSDGVVVRGCTIVNNDGVGIDVWGSDNVNVTEAQIINNTESGISVWDGWNNTFNNCTLSQNENGFQFRGDSQYSSIYSSNIFSNSEEGIWLRDVPDILIKRCVISNNSKAIRHFGDRTSVIGCKIKSSEWTYNDYFHGRFEIYNKIGISIERCRFIDEFISIKGNEVQHYNSHVITNCTLNGKPIIFIKNESSYSIESDVSQIIIVGSSNVNINDCVFNYTETLKVVYSDNVTISSSSFDQLPMGLTFEHCTDTKVDNCTFSKIEDYAIRLDDSNEAYIDNCLIEHCLSGIRSKSDNTTITNSNITFTSGTGIGVMGQRTSIVNCTVSDSGIGGGILINSATGSRVTDCTLVNDSIQFWGSDIEHFTTHFIFNNTVNGKQVFFKLNSSEFIIPNDVGQIIVVNCSYFSYDGAQFNASPHIMMAHCNNVIFESSKKVEVPANIRLFQSSNVYFVNVSARSVYMIGVDNSTLFNCTIDNPSSVGLTMNDGDNNTISGCEIHSASSNAFSMDTGIRNLVINSNLSGSRRSLYLRDTLENSFVNCIMRNNWDEAILSRNAVDDTYIDNNISDNIGVGLRSYSSEGLMVKNCSFINNSIGLDIMDSKRFIIQNNLFINNQGEGIVLDEARTISIYDNELRRNHGYGVSADRFTVRCMIHHNNFIDNIISINATAQGLDDGGNSSSNDWDYGSSGNYWSDYTGTDTDDDGIGEEKYHIDGDSPAKDRYPLVNELDIEVGGNDMPYVILIPNIDQLTVNRMASETIAISYYASDKDSIANVTFTYSDGESGDNLIGYHEENDRFGTIEWDITNVTNGTHYICATIDDGISQPFSFCNSWPIRIEGIYSSSIITVDDDGGADYQFIQDAIDNATAGDTILVYEGLFIENLVIPVSITIVGNGSEETIIDGNNTGNVIEITGSDVNISHITIRNGSRAGINLTNNSAAIFNSTIIDNVQGIYSNGSYGHTIKNCNVSDNYIGIHYNSSVKIHVANNTCSNNDDYGLFISSSDNITIIFNEIFGNGNYGIYSSGSTQMKVHHNNFANNTGASSQAYDNTSHNEWDDGITEGNYWSDWSGSGTYSIDGPGNAEDRYPHEDPVETSSPEKIPEIAILPTIFIVITAILWNSRRRT